MLNTLKSLRNQRSIRGYRFTYFILFGSEGTLKVLFTAANI